MFTGIVEQQVEVLSFEQQGDMYRLALDVGPLADEVGIGDSIAVNGACLTAVVASGGRLEFDLIRETIERTCFAEVQAGHRVNLERAMRADGRYDGHVVSGHIDGTGKIVVKRPDEGQVLLTVETGPELLRYLIEKGSVTIDGVSLTVTEVTETSFSVCLIPHTLGITNLGHKGQGHLVNLEVDPVGKWVDRLLKSYLPAT